MRAKQLIFIALSLLLTLTAARRHNPKSRPAKIAAMENLNKHFDLDDIATSDLDILNKEHLYEKSER